MQKPDLKNRPTGAITVDAVVFHYQPQAGLRLALIRRNKEPYKDSWAIPGGFLEGNEDAEQGVLRELAEETELKGIFLEQFFTFTHPQRDPRGRVISIAYIGLVDATLPLHADADAADARWWSTAQLPPLAFDHDAIIHKAQVRLKDLVQSSFGAYKLLPKHFTLTQLQQLYEGVLDITLDKRNFRKKILGYDFIKETNKMTQNLRSRPARLYIFDQKAFTRLQEKGLYSGF